MIYSLPALFTASIPAILGLGFFLGLKHATEADHLAAVSTIVSDRKSIWNSMLVGGLWGVGHTISLFIAGVLVLLLDFQIGERTEQALEFCVGWKNQRVPADCADRAHADLNTNSG